MERYDVIIIGAGPAGLSCAGALGGSGHSVAVLESLKNPGVKTCAGGLTPGSRLYDAVSDRYREFGRHKVIINHREFEVDIGDPLKVIDRLDLAALQVEELEGYRNIIMKRGVRAESISAAQNGCTVRTAGGETIGCRYLVGAGGARSVTRSFLGLDERFSVGLSYRIEAKFETVTWYFNPSVLGCGYCWIFPHRGYISCGVYYHPQYTRGKAAAAALDRFLQERGIDSGEEELSGFPVSSRFRGLNFGNIFLCGDAAGAAMPATGEGINPAAETGEAVGSYLAGDRKAFSRLRKMIRARRRQNAGLRLMRALRGSALQSAALEVLARAGSRIYMNR